MSCTTGRLTAAIVAASLAAARCDLHQMTTARLTPLFGPVIGKEAISGHVLKDDEVWLMTGSGTLVRVDLAHRVQQTLPLRLPPREDCWGLARLADGTLWTLMGWNTAIQIGPDGDIARTETLPTAHLGIFGVEDRLVFQPGSLPAGGATLFAARPGEQTRVPWSSLTNRRFASLAMGAAAAMNLVSCGISHTSETPCWFPDEPVVHLIDRNGVTRRIDLAGLPHVAPEQLINAKAPPRPIRDVYIEANGAMWVIGTGSAREGTHGPGGWLLAKYNAHGQPLDRRQLPEPARVILRAGAGRTLLLTGTGMIVEVDL